MAGSGIRGQFEEKFKGLIRDIEDEVGIIVVPHQYSLKGDLRIRQETSYVLLTKSVSYLYVPGA